MRAYFFGNMYLSSIQQGIQAAHAVHEMFIRYPESHCVINRANGTPPFDGDFLWDWAVDHKTMILLNGGYAETIQELVDFFKKSDNPYPWADFHEEEASLNGALTTVGIVLPEKIYLTAAAIRNDPNHHELGSIRNLVWADGELAIGVDNTMGFDIDQQVVLEFSKWEAQLMDRLNGFNMAS